MNIVIPFHEGDKAQVARWLQWAEELGGMGAHRLFLMPAMRQKADFKTFMPFTVLEDSYGLKSNWSASNNPVRDAAAPNSMIRQIAWHFYLNKLGYWLFCEPDAIPLRPGWHDALDEEYRRERKYYMGALVPGKEGEYPEHMTGVAIWPENAITCRSLMLPTHATVEGHSGQVELAFDVAAANEIIGGGSFHATRLIQHVFRGPKFDKPEDLKRIDSKAVLFHTDKDGGLIDLLRISRGGEVGTQEPHKLPQAGSIPAPATNIVYTYYRQIKGRDQLEQEWLLSQWAGRWIKAGWIPKVIGPNEASSHPFFNDFMALVSTLPTVNMREYEEACWLRWLAMVQVGGGLMTDYDVFNYGLSPQEIEPPSGELPCILADHNPCPCAVLGTAQQYANMVNVIMTRAKASIGTERGQPHLSDQSFVQKHASLFTTRDICFQHGRSGSDLAKLVHYSHSSCQGRPRKDVIPPIEQMRSEASAPVIKSMTEADHIAALVSIAKKSGINKGRITKRLKDAGFALKK
jgi:hypothetical protein